MTYDFGAESAFLMKPTQADCDIKVRYFMPLHETDMCMHATVGSVTALDPRHNQPVWETAGHTAHDPFPKQKGKIRSFHSGHRGTTAVQSPDSNDPVNALNNGGVYLL